jgi:uroporphyrinogen III methyltransferase / synthase
MERKGKVYLVGAGPGDIGLLTIKGLKCLKTAEVVVYDFHLNAQILNYIGRETEFIYAGKRGGRHTMKQEEINEVLVTKAKEGKIVCRLKGGDPFVFGRGGEEAEALVDEGIEFEVVPGVSSSVAAPAYAGIPLTHRLYSSSFAVVPGYEDIAKKESAIDWTKLATGVGTIVFLMAVRNIELICRKLVEHGRPPETPVAIIRWGTRPEQRTLVGALSSIPALVREKDIHPPAVMVVGEVVKLREKLKWYEKKPLFGQRILITREQTTGFECLEDLGAEILAFPTIEIVPAKDWSDLDRSLENIHEYDWLIFTSRNGVKYFFSRFFGLDRDIRELAGIRICSIGSKTSEEVRKFGLKVDLTPIEFRAEGLIDAIIGMNDGSTERETRGGSLKGIRFLLPRAEKAREILPEKIRALGGEIDIPIVYRTVKPETKGKRLRRFLSERKVSLATFTSASTFDNFLEIMGEDGEKLLKDIPIAVIGPVTAKAVEAAGLRAEIIPEEATTEAMARSIISWAKERADRALIHNESSDV